MIFSQQPLGTLLLLLLLHVQFFLRSTAQLEAPLLELLGWDDLPEGPLASHSFDEAAEQGVKLRFIEGPYNDTLSGSGAEIVTLEGLVYLEILAKVCCDDT